MMVSDFFETFAIPEYHSTTLDKCPTVSKKIGLQEVFNMCKGSEDLGPFFLVIILTIISYLSDIFVMC